MSFGTSLGDLEAITPDPRLWYKHGGTAPIDASSLRDLGLLPHAILPVLCLLPATIAAVRFAVRGRYDISALATCLTLVSQAYHHCRLSGHDHVGLLGATMTDASCDTWRQVDVLALMASFSFVAANVVGLADWRVITIAATAFPAKAVHLVMLTEDTKYHHIVHTLFWWVFIVVANPLMARHSLDGGIKDLDSALHPDLRKRDPLPRVIMPFFIAVACFVAPCAGPNLIGDPSIYWPSMWGCHAAIGLSMCGILGAELQSVADREAAARQAAAPRAVALRKPHQRLAPRADRKPKELSDKCRKRLSSKLSETGKDLAQAHKEAAIELTKIRVTGNARVEIIADGDELEAKYFGGETPSEDDALWAPSYSLGVEFDIGVSYGEGHGFKFQTPQGASKVTKKRAKGHCAFNLSQSKGESATLYSTPTLIN